MEEEFKIRENGFEEIKKVLIIRSLVIGVLMVGTGLAISYFNSNGQSLDMTTLAIFIPFIMGAMGLGLYNGIKKQKGLFKSYKLTINDSEIIREQENTQTILIPKNEVKSITKHPKGGLVIVGNAKINTIAVPPQINNSERLEELLTQIQPIDSNKKNPNGIYSAMSAILTMVLMATISISTNKLILGISGTILILILSYSFYVLQRSKNIDKKTKRITWLLLIVLFSIIGNIYFKLTA